MSNRYVKRKKIINNNLFYEKKFIDKGIKNIEQYPSPRFFYPSIEQKQNLPIEKYIWKQGDSLEKLSAKYYGDIQYWWVIAHYNQKPTEQHFTVGDIIIIPTLLGTVVKILGY